jgi:hypothetical protein
MSADITFKLKRGVIEGVTPPSLTHGELAVNTTDKRLFVGGLNGEIIPFNKNYVSPVTPSNPVEGDYWFDGSSNYAYYDNSWLPAGSSGNGGIDPNQLIVYNAGLSGTGDVTFVGGTLRVLSTEPTEENPDVTGGNVFIAGDLIVLGSYPGASSAVNTNQTFYLNRGIVVTGGAVINNGMTAYGNFNLNGNVRVNGVNITSLIVGTGSSAIGYGENTFIGLQTMNAGLTTSHLYVSRGATFANGINITKFGMSLTGGMTAYGNINLNGNVKVNGVLLNVTDTINTAANTFIGLQTMNAGLTTSHLYVSQGATFNGGINVRKGASITGGLTAYGTTNIVGTFLVNGSPIGGVSLGTVNTFTALQKMTEGLFVGGGGGPPTGGLNIDAPMQVTGRALFRNGVAFLKGVTFAGGTSVSAYFTTPTTFNQSNQFYQRIKVDMPTYNGVGVYVNYGWTRVGMLLYSSQMRFSDRSLKKNIEEYTESGNEQTIFGKKWLSGIRNQFKPYSYQYIANGISADGPFYGYMADELQYMDPRLVVATPGLTGNGDIDPGVTTYNIYTDNLIFGAIEAIRELDAEAARIWRTSCIPPPSRSKDNDLWFDPTTSKMYMRFNDGTQSQWIQTS